jgi:hypothetical protein
MIIELRKETDMIGKSSFFVYVDDSYVSNTCASSEDEGIRNFEDVKATLKNGKADRVEILRYEEI